jgi:heme/copper-type cytochrome/quinol oxidase subunit 2
LDSLPSISRRYSIRDGSSNPKVTTWGAVLRPSRRAAAILAMVIVVAGFFSAAYAFQLFGPGSPNCWVRPSGAANTAIFTVVMANEGINVGYNGSRYHPFPWPVINVSLGQNVVIHLVNNDTQAHGFSIIHFFESGIVVSPRECYDVRFTANTMGNFTVFCQIICSIHRPWMQNGRLNVNP